MKSIDSEYYKYPCIQMHICVRTFNALFSPGPWMINELYRSLKGSLIHCLPSSGNSEPRSYCSSLKGCGQTRLRSDSRSSEADKLPGNCNNS